QARSPAADPPGSRPDTLREHVMDRRAALTAVLHVHLCMRAWPAPRADLDDRRGRRQSSLTPMSVHGAGRDMCSDYLAARLVVSAACPHRTSIQGRLRDGYLMLNCHGKPDCRC